MLVKYKITIIGRLPSDSRAEANQYVREGISLSFPLHESIDEFLIETEGEDFTDMKTRFPG